MKWLALCAGLALAASGGAAADERTVVVLLFDGVAAATLGKAPTPTFDRLRSEGAWSHTMEGSFPAISLIGGITLSTGCWPARHGIVSNLFDDPERGRYDHSRDPGWLLACEHVHQAAERQGVASAALGWFGSHSEARGPEASVVGAALYQDFPEDAVRAEQVAEQIGRSDAERPRLILAYFKGPDSAQHFTGMDSAETRDAVAAMDANVARILSAIENGPRPEETTLVISTDHGMVPVETLVNIERILRWHDIPARAVANGTTAFLYFEDRSVIDAAVETLARYEEIEAYRTDALPERARIGTSGRVGDVFVSAVPPYVMEDSSSWPIWLRWLARVGPRFVPTMGMLHASHGYPADVAGMRGVLYAWGRGIARGQHAGNARSIDVHPTVTYLLGIEPGRPVDGSVARELLAD